MSGDFHAMCRHFIYAILIYRYDIICILIRNLSTNALFKSCLNRLAVI